VANSQAYSQTRYVKRKLKNENHELKNYISEYGQKYERECVIHYNKNTVALLNRSKQSPTRHMLMTQQ